jgi:2-C-methyl-D-erythritol 4-phosphate cytidylyltransferase
MRSLRKFEENVLVDSIVFSTNREMKELIEPLMKFFKTEVLFTISEEGRPKAVYDGLNSFIVEPDIVLIHDGARPFLSSNLVMTVIQNTLETGAVIPGIKPSTPLLEKVGSDYNVLDKERHVLVQTPQGFRYDIVKEAYDKAFAEGKLNEFTDSASVVEWAGNPVTVIPGEARNLKLTTPEDLERIEHFFEK